MKEKWEKEAIYVDGVRLPGKEEFKAEGRAELILVGGIVLILIIIGVIFSL